MDLIIEEKIDKGLYYKKLSNDKVINLTGEGGSGKSTIANEYKKDADYLVVDYDLILLAPEVGTIEYELRQMLLEKYGKTFFEVDIKSNIEKLKENFTLMYQEIIDYLSRKNKTIVLDGTQLRFIKDVKLIKGEFVALRPSLQTCISQSVQRYIQNNPHATTEQVHIYAQKRTKVLKQLNPLMNELLIRVESLPSINDPEILFDREEIQSYLLTSLKNFLNVLKRNVMSHFLQNKFNFLIFS